MKRYGQYCPVARAAEILAERWTLLVVRELLWGNDRFNAIARGVPRMSPTLLSTRLHQLQHAGIVERRLVEGEPHYTLTEAGLELRPLVEAMGAWGQRWMQQLVDDDFDPTLLMIDIGREPRGAEHGLPARSSVVHLRLGPAGRHLQWWLVFSDRGLDVCDTDPGQPVRAWLDTDVQTLTRVWLGQVGWSDAVATGSLRVHGEAAVCLDVRRWLGVSRFAAVETAPTSLAR